MTAPATDDERAQAAVAADLLAHGRVVHHLSAALTIVAVAGVPLLAILQPHRLAMTLASLAAIVGLAELWFALRVAFDARIFRRLTQGGSTTGLTLSVFDSTMVALGLMPPDKTGRPVVPRVRGALGLLVRQAVLLLLQVALLLAAGWLLATTRGT